jgi:hypothetical protein
MYYFLDKSTTWVVFSDQHGDVQKNVIPNTLGVTRSTTDLNSIALYFQVPRFFTWPM